MYTFESKAQCRFLAPFIPFDAAQDKLWGEAPLPLKSPHQPHLRVKTTHPIDGYNGVKA